MEFEDIKKPQYTSLKDTAIFLGVSLPTMYRMIKCGKIKPTNVAKSGTKPIYAFSAEDVQAYYDSIGKRGSKNHS